LDGEKEKLHGTLGGGGYPCRGKELGRAGRRIGEGHTNRVEGRVAVRSQRGGQRKPRGRGVRRNTKVWVETTRQGEVSG